jgi:hypothetical protein
MPFPYRAGLLAGVLLATAASAQTINLNFAGSGSQITTLNRGQAGCNDQVQVVWTTTGLSSANACGSLQIWVTNSQTCADAPSSGTSADGGVGTDLSIGTFSLASQTQGTATTFRVSDIPGVAGGGGCSAAIDVRNAICASVAFRNTIGGTCGTLQAGNLIVRYDNVAPAPPSVGPLLAQDSRIIVPLGSGGDPDVVFYLVQYAINPTNPGDTPNWTTTPQIPATVTSYAINGLVNGTTYVVQAFSLDQVNNQSLASAQQTATPQATDGFWAQYKAAGGTETGGCSSTGSALSPALLALGALGVLGSLVRRRR